MARVAARVSDKLVLKLIRAFLNAGVMEDGLVRPVDEGTPQGGPLSPILSNLVLDDLDKELARRGHRFCRYADDCNIYVRSRRAGERVMASVSRFLTNKLRLKVNEAKSAVARPEERKFLGFSISNDGSERRIAPKALDTFKERIRDMTRRTRGFGLQQLIKELKPYLVGWRGYFGFCQTPRVLTNLEAWIRRRLRVYSLAAMANQAKPLRGVTPSRRSKVPSGGRGWFTNRVMAHVRTPGGPTSPTQRLFRDARSSPNLCARPSLTRSNRRGTGPVCPVVWEGWRREASPYPDLTSTPAVRCAGAECRLSPVGGERDARTRGPIASGAEAREADEQLAHVVGSETRINNKASAWRARVCWRAVVGKRQLHTEGKRSRADAEFPQCSLIESVQFVR